MKSERTRGCRELRYMYWLRRRSPSTDRGLSGAAGCGMAALAAWAWLRSEPHVQSHWVAKRTAIDKLTRQPTTAPDLEVTPSPACVFECSALPHCLRVLSRPCCRHSRRLVRPSAGRVCVLSVHLHKRISLRINQQCLSVAHRDGVQIGYDATELCHTQYYT